jgi:hypothetical protein
LFLVVLVAAVVAGKAPPPLPSDHLFFAVFLWFLCFWQFCFFILVVLAVAGKAPWGTPCHQILVVFDGFGGFWLFCAADRGFSCCW